MRTTLSHWNLTPALGRDPTSHVAVMPLSADPPLDYSMAAAGHSRPIRSPDFTGVLIFSVIGLVVSIGLSLLLPLSQETASFFAQFG